MGEKSGGERKPEPNLELPSIFGRRKKRRRAEPDDADRTQGAQPQSVITEEPSSPPAEQDAVQPQGDRAGGNEVQTAPAAGTDGATSLVEPAHDRDRDTAGPEIAAAPTAKSNGADRTGPAAHDTEPQGTPSAPPEAEATRRLPNTAYAAREQGTVSSPEIPTRAPETAPRPEADTAPDSTTDTEHVSEPASSAPTDRAADRRAAQRAAGRRAARPSGPILPGPVAAVLTGLVVGLFGAGATYGGTQACDAWRGTSSCGGGPGLLLLIAILALMVLLGAVLLALLAVPEPRSTSFLGVGLTFVVVLVALMSAVFSFWMFFAAPVLSAVAYGVAHWVTTRHVELPEAGPEHDVR